MGARQIPRAGEIIAADDARVHIDRVGRRIDEAVVLDRHGALSRGDPDIVLSRRLCAGEGAVFHRKPAGSASLLDGVITGRPAKGAVLDRHIVSADQHRRRAEIDAAQHRAGLRDGYRVSGRRVKVRRLGILGDLGDVDQRRRGDGIARLRVDARQNGAGIDVADHLDFGGGVHAVVPRSQARRDPLDPSHSFAPL